LVKVFLGMFMQPHKPGFALYLNTCIDNKIPIRNISPVVAIFACRNTILASRLLSFTVDLYLLTTC